MSNVDSWKSRMILQLFICLTAAGLVGKLFLCAILVHGAKIWYNILICFILINIGFFIMRTAQALCIITG